MTDLAEIAHRRLYPSLTNSSYLVLRARRFIFSRWIHKLGNQQLDVLDVGGRYQPYRPLLGDRVRKYIAVDVVKTELVSVMADGQALPFAEESFDLVIATQVFEYFPNPHLAAQQMHAVLRPGGSLLASVAAFTPRFVNPEHWRFTSTGIRSILNLFASVEIIPELYSTGGLIRSVNVGLEMMLPYEKARSVYRRTLCPVVNVLGLCLETLKLTSNDQLTPNYSVHATKAA